MIHESTQIYTLALVKDKHKAFGVLLSFSYEETVELLKTTGIGLVRTITSHIY